MASPSKRALRALPADVQAALQQAVKDASSQRVVGDALGYSAAVISQALRGTYAGDVETLAQRIRGKYMAETVDCPVMGQLPRNNCLDNQRRPLAFTNPQRVALFRACKSCPHRKDAA